MSSEWQIVEIRSLCEGIFDGPHATPKKTDRGPIFLGISSLNNGRLDLNSLEYLSEDDFAKWTKRVTPHEGDIVFSYETRLGQAAIIPSGLRCCLGRRMALMRLNQTKALPDYILYAYLCPDFQEIIRQRTIHGTTVDRIPLNEFGRFPISIPPLNIQRQIAGVLRALDDRISLLRETNRTLEEMARLLFRAWFVDFEPVRAKMAGRISESCDAETAELFPSRLVESVFGEIPEGWEIGCLADLFSVIGGGTPKTSVKEYWNGDIHWYSVVDAPNDVDIFVIDTEKKITYEGLQNSSTKLLQQGTTIISARGTVGKLAIVGREMAMNQSCYGLQGNKGDIFTFYAVKTAIDTLKQNAHGAIFDTITNSTFRTVKAIIPKISICKVFEQQTNNFMSRIKKNVETIKSLKKTRDELLPRLMSGSLTAFLISNDYLTKFMLLKIIPLNQ